MIKTAETPALRWFEQFSGCHVCGSASQLGILRGAQNESYGNHCRKCADKRLKASAKARGEA